MGKWNQGWVDGGIKESAGYETVRGRVMGPACVCRKNEPLGFEETGGLATGMAYERTGNRDRSHMMEGQGPRREKANNDKDIDRDGEKTYLFTVLWVIKVVE
jgi:hypothetical protein